MKADVYSLGIIAQKVFNIDINEYFNFLKSKVTLLPEMIFQ
jgi:hypothetical protein